MCSKHDSVTQVSLTEPQNRLTTEFPFRLVLWHSNPSVFWFCFIFIRFASEIATNAPLEKHPYTQPPRTFKRSPYIWQWSHVHTGYVHTRKYGSWKRSHVTPHINATMEETATYKCHCSCVVAKRKCSTFNVCERLTFFPIMEIEIEGQRERASEKKKNKQPSGKF